MCGRSGALDRGNTRSVGTKKDVGFAERRIVNNRTLPPLSADRGSVSAGVNDDDGWLADDYGDDDDDAVRRLGSGFA